jgi:hypothetical protein
MASDAEIRAWAREQNLDNVPARGSLPGWVRDAHEAYHSVNGEAIGGADDSELAAPSPGEVRPKSVRPGRAGGRWPGFGRPAGKKPKTKKRPPRVSVEDLVAGVWGAIAGAGAALMPATSKMMKFQAPVAGAVLEGVIEGTIVDRALQPIARSAAAGEAIGALALPPIIIGAIEMNPARAPFLIPILRPVLLRWHKIAGPKLAELEEREAAFEEEFGQDVDALIAEILMMIPHPSEGQPADERQGDELADTLA